MPETLVLRLNSSADQPHTWMVVDAAGTRIGEISRGHLQELSQLTENRPLTVLLPANFCLVSHSDLPVKNNQKLLQALPYAFEDQMIGDIESAHFSIGQRDDKGHFPVAIVNRELLDQQLALLAENKLTPHRMYPEDAMIPVTEGGCTILLEEHEGILRTANGDAVMMDHSSLLFGLELAQAQLEQTEDDFAMPVTVYLDDSSGASGEEISIKINELYPQAEFRRLPHGALSKLAVESIQSGHPNLLQGDYAPSTNFDKLLAPWRNVALAAGLLLAIAIAFKAVELKTMKTRLVEVNGAMMQLAKETFPDQQKIIDPYGMFRTRLKEIGGGGGDGRSDFLDFLGVVASATATNDALTLHRLNYRIGNLDIEVEATNVQALDGFTNKIASDANWSANLLSTKPSGDKVQGRLSIQRKAP